MRKKNRKNGGACDNVYIMITSEQSFPWFVIAMIKIRSSVIRSSNMATKLVVRAQYPSPFLSISTLNRTDFNQSIISKLIICSIRFESGRVHELSVPIMLQ